MDGLTTKELEDAARHRDLLRPLRPEVHFDAMFRAIVERLMLKGVRIEGPLQLVIDADKHVAVEGGRNTLRVVIGRQKNAKRLLQVRPNDKTRVPAKVAAPTAS